MNRWKSTNVRVAGWGSWPMDDTERHSPEYYREKAAEIRQFARRAHSSDVILELLETAELFDRMATHVERRYRMAAV
jgi:hypothetical protein